MTTRLIVTLAFLIIAIVTSAAAKSIEDNSPPQPTNGFEPDDNGLMDYNDCGNGNLRRLKVQGCEPEAEQFDRFCLLTRGSNASLVAKFDVDDYDYQRVTTDVRIKIGFLEFGYPPIEYDACRNYVHCPLTRNSINVARVTFPIPSLVPRFTNMLITARLYGPNNELIVCGQARAGLI